METYIKDIDYEIFIIEQADNKPFNRGKLLNAGYKYAVDKGCDYFVFHDVDMLPENVDYSYSDKPLHLATHLQEHDYETTFFDYFGGVTMFTKEDFKTINGYSNEYWGWGFEDDDLLVRCVEAGLETDTEISGDGEIEYNEYFQFKGDSAHIRLKTDKTTHLLEDEFTISVLVKPENIILNENKEYDEFPIISIPGYNTGIFYNSFRRFFCQAYDADKKPYSISTDILGERWVHLAMKYETPGMLKGSNTWRISLYVDGEFYDSIDLGCEIMPLSTNEIYIGAGSGKRGNTDFFYGLISDIEIYDIALGDEEIRDIYLNPKKIKIRNFENYKSSQFLYSQILPELSSGNSCIDLGQRYSVKLNNIYLYKDKQSFKSFLPKPCRRESRFTSLKHKTNSSNGNRWVHDATRKNQLKFYNEIKKNFVDFRIDGLNTLRFTEIGKINDGLVTRILIEL